MPFLTSKNKVEFYTVSKRIADSTNRVFVDVEDVKLKLTRGKGGSQRPMLQSQVSGVKVSRFISREQMEAVIKSFPDTFKRLRIASSSSPAKRRNSTRSSSKKKKKNAEAEDDTSGSEDSYRDYSEDDENDDDRD